MEKSFLLVKEKFWFLLPLSFYMSSSPIILKQDNHFQNYLIGSISLHMAYEERKNKQTNLKFWLENHEFSFFSLKIAIYIVYVSCHCWSNKDFHEWFQFPLLFKPLQSSLSILRWLSLNFF